MIYIAYHIRFIFLQFYTKANFIRNDIFEDIFHFLYFLDQAVCQKRNCKHRNVLFLSHREPVTNDVLASVNEPLASSIHILNARK